MKTKKEMLLEAFNVLDKCTCIYQQLNQFQDIIKEDKLKIRQELKQGNQELLQLIYKNRKADLHQLQIELRKIATNFKKIEQPILLEPSQQRIKRQDENKDRNIIRGRSGSQTQIKKFFNCSFQKNFSPSRKTSLKQIKTAPMSKVLVLRLTEPIQNQENSTISLSQVEVKEIHLQEQVTEDSSNQYFDCELETVKSQVIDEKQNEIDTEEQVLLKYNADEIYGRERQNQVQELYLQNLCIDQLFDIPTTDQDSIKSTQSKITWRLSQQSSIFRLCESTTSFNLQRSSDIYKPYAESFLIPSE